MGAAITLKRIQTSDQNLMFIQDNVAQALQSLQSVPFGGGSLVQVASASNGVQTTALPLIAGQDNVFQHTLGYAPKLVLPLAPNVQSTIWNPSSTKTTITIRCSVTCTAAVWIT